VLDSRLPKAISQPFYALWGNMVVLFLILLSLFLKLTLGKWRKIKLKKQA
jgi:hypothetical protein